MPAKRKASDASGAPAAKVRNVSEKRQNHALVSMQADVFAQRMEAQLSLINEECRKDPQTLDTCFCVSVRGQKRREADEDLHRNLIVQQAVPACRKIGHLRNACLNITEEAMCGLESDKKHVHESFYWASGYSPCTEIGVTAMPLKNYDDITSQQIQNRPEVEDVRSRTKGALGIDPQRLHGHFGLHPFDGTEDITEIIHHQSKKVATLPFGIRIPRSKVAPPVGAVIVGEDGLTLKRQEELFWISRWGCHSTAMLKGPGGLNLSLAKLFNGTDHNQPKVDFPPIMKCMIQTQADSEIALRPTPSNPDRVISLRPGVLEYIAGREAGEVPATPRRPPRSAARASPASSDADSFHSPSSQVFAGSLNYLGGSPLLRLELGAPASSEPASAAQASPASASQEVLPANGDDDDDIPLSGVPITQG